MCAFLIPAIIGVAAFATLGGGSCNTCVVIPQQVGEGTNVVAVSSQNQFAYAQPQQSFGYGAPQQGFAPHQGFAQQQNFGPQQGFSGQQQGVGASIGMNGQSAMGVGTYSNPGGAGIGANIGDASIGMGTRSY